MNTPTSENIGSSHAYVCGGALLKCDKGTLPSQLFIAARAVSIGNQSMANANDKDPVLNKLNFGVCSITQKPCLATIRPLRWLDVKRDVEVAGAEALLDCSSLPCAMGGSITFVQTGQLA